MGHQVAQAHLQEVENHPVAVVVTTTRHLLVVLAVIQAAVRGEVWAVAALVDAAAVVDQVGQEVPEVVVVAGVEVDRAVVTQMAAMIPMAEVEEVRKEDRAVMTAAQMEAEAVAQAGQIYLQ